MDKSTQGDRPKRALVELRGGHRRNQFAPQSRAVRRQRGTLSVCSTGCCHVRALGSAAPSRPVPGYITLQRAYDSERSVVGWPTSLDPAWFVYWSHREGPRHLSSLVALPHGRVGGLDVTGEASGVEQGTTLTIARETIP